ncbi:MAG TPA: OmpA family protein [Kofleriaceae bacterium]|nr:OmpA family protein [Kofleriaceae bacterium]
MHRIGLVMIVGALTSSVAGAEPAKGSASSGIVTFSGTSARLSPTSRETLENIAAWQRARPDALLIVDGYATRAGSRSRNLRISQQRTDVVRDALVDAGADASRLVLVAHGAENARSASTSAQRVVIRTASGFGQSSSADLADAPPAAPPPATPAAPATSTIVVIGGTSAANVRSASSDATTNEALANAGTHPSQSGVPGRTSGGLGTSALTGIGIDPTDGVDYPSTTIASGGGATGGDTATSAPIRSGGVLPGAGTAYPGGPSATGARAGTSGAVGAGVTGSGIGPTGIGTGPATASALGNATGAGTGVANGTSGGTATGGR